MSRQSAEKLKWYESQRKWHDNRMWECWAKGAGHFAEDWHIQERDWYSARLAALSVKGK